MSSAVSSCRQLILAEQPLEGSVLGWVVSGVILPTVPDYVEPGAGEDAGGVGVIFAAGGGVFVELGGPGAGAAGVGGEVADGVAQLPGGGPAVADGCDLAGLAGEGVTPARHISEEGSGKRWRQSPIIALAAGW
jgi:hypothetical protein